MKNIAVLIEDDLEDLESLESALKTVDPTIFCICCIHSDEAVRVISEELKTLPQYIFIDVNMSRKTGAECLACLRGRNELNACKVIMFSVVMPQTVGDSFMSLGADFAFQKPSSAFGYNDIVRDIMRHVM